MKRSFLKSVFRKSQAAAMALTVAAALLSPLGAIPVKASPLDDGELWIGKMRVTADNCADIFGNGTASYDPDTLTLTLNGVHIGPNDCHIADSKGNTQEQMSRTEEDWGVYSLYAKNTVAHIVVNGDNTFETPAVEREMYEKTYDPTGTANLHYNKVDRQLRIWVGAVIDSSGIDVAEMSVTGSGTFKSHTPAIVVEEQYSDEDKDQSSLAGMNSGQTGVGLYWNAGNTEKTLTVGTPGGEGPVLDLRGGVSGLTLKSFNASFYNADLKLQALKGECYNARFAPHACALYNFGEERPSVVNLYEKTKMRANVKEGYNNGPESVIDYTSSFHNQIALLSKDDMNAFWYEADLSEPPGDTYRENIWVVWGTRKMAQEAEKEAEEAAAAAKRRNLDIDPEAEDYADTDIEVLGFTKDAVVYSVDVEWGAMTFSYQESAWDATEHKTVPGAGWRVYDSRTNQALSSETEAVNRLTVTNHSNAEIWAKLYYDGAENYTDTSAYFFKDTNDTDTDFNERSSYLKLNTADNSGDSEIAGTPTSGIVYLMPFGIGNAQKTEGVTKWSQLGTITVSVLTEEP